MKRSVLPQWSSVSCCLRLQAKVAGSDSERRFDVEAAQTEVTTLLQQCQAQRRDFNVSHCRPHIYKASMHLCILAFITSMRIASMTV